MSRFTRAKKIHFQTVEGRRSVLESMRSDRKIEKLLIYCDLDWSNDCLNFYNNDRPVKTASDTQVRKKIYRSSVNSWENYDKYLSKYFSKLKS